MVDFVFVQSFANDAVGRFIRVGVLVQELQRLGVDPVCCEFAALPDLLQKYLQDNFPAKHNVVAF